MAVAALASEGVAEDPAHYLMPHPTDCDKFISCQVIIITCHLILTSSHASGWEAEDTSHQGVRQEEIRRRHMENSSRIHVSVDKAKNEERLVRG